MRTRNSSNRCSSLHCILQILSVAFVFCIASNTLDKYLLNPDIEVIILADDSQEENEPSELELNEEIETDDYFHSDVLPHPISSLLDLDVNLQKINSYLGYFREITTPPPEPSV